MSDSEKEEKLLTVEELADRLQYSPDWVRLQVKTGRIPVIKFNQRAWRFHWTTVLTALQHWN
jgi:excisionase family DNA binding protein